MLNESLRIDPHALNGLEFRIDAFSVPAGSRDRFEALMRRNVAFIETLPGLLHHTVFEKTQGTTLNDIVTIAVWSGPESNSSRRRARRSAPITGPSDSISRRSLRNLESQPRSAITVRRWSCSDATVRSRRDGRYGPRTDQAGVEPPAHVARVVGICKYEGGMRKLKKQSLSGSSCWRRVFPLCRKPWCSDRSSRSQRTNDEN